jgi:hypothetical protein
MFEDSGGAECYTDHYLVVEKVRERLTVSKQAPQKFDVEGFNLRKLNYLESMKQYQIEIANRSATLENVSDDEDINRGLGERQREYHSLS